jgi:beta-phosphoglucomutase
MPLRALQAIVFDFDGVIADSEYLHLRAYQQVLAPEGISITNEEYFDRYLGYDDVGVFKALLKDKGLPLDEGRMQQLVERKSQRYESLAAAGEMLFPGAADFIRTAAAAVPIAIASGALTSKRCWSEPDCGSCFR